MERLRDVYEITSPLGDRYVTQYVLVGSRATLLIDTGVAGMAEDRIIPYMNEIGAPSSRPLYVLNTHADVDHIGGNAELKAKLPRAVLMAHQLDRAWIESKGRIMNEQYGWYRAHGLDYSESVRDWIERGLGRQIPLDLVIVGGEKILLSDDWEVSIIHLPGHSPGHVAVHDPKNKSLIISDAILYRGLLDSSGKIIGPPKYYDADQYIESIKKCRKIAPDHLLTAHYGVYSHEKVEEFLSESLRFIRDVERATLTALRDSGSAMTLKELLEPVNKMTGPFTSLEIELAAAIRSHLKRLEQEGLVRRTRKGGLQAWLITQRGKKARR